MKFLLDEHCLSIRKACASIGLSRSAWYRPLVDWTERDRLVLVHGSTLHGFQYQQAEKRHIPTMYYTRESGVGRAILHHPRYRDGTAPFRMGVVGLGVGTLSYYARQGDYLRYYEIDPKVVQIADQYFTFDEDARKRGVDLEVYLGDARIVMEQQLAGGRSEQFDLLVIDAFSSDAIPAHLLTRECFQVYQKHLAPGGVLAIHISNRHVDLSPVLRAAAESLHMQARPLNYSPGNGQTADVLYASKWHLVTSNQDFLSQPELGLSPQKPPPDEKTILWTDDYNNLFKVLR